MPVLSLAQRRIQLVEGVFQLHSNAPELIHAEEYFGAKDVQSLLTNYYTEIGRAHV